MRWFVLGVLILTLANHALSQANVKDPVIGLLPDENSVPPGGIVDPELLTSLAANHWPQRKQETREAACRAIAAKSDAPLRNKPMYGFLPPQWPFVEQHPSCLHNRLFQLNEW